MASKASKRRRKRRRRSAAQPSAPASPDRAAERAERPARRRRRGGEEEPPPAPWGSFPLVELAVLVGIVMLFAGLLFVGGDRGRTLIVTGLALGSIGGLELSIREHFAGYRSHTLVLAAVPAAVVLGVLFLAGPGGLPPVARLGIGAVAFAVAAAWLTRVFRDRSGGLSFKVGGFRRR